MMRVEPILLPNNFLGQRAEQPIKKQEKSSDGSFAGILKKVIAGEQNPRRAILGSEASISHDFWRTGHNLC